jgi:hypothetical protein
LWVRVWFGRERQERGAAQHELEMVLGIIWKPSSDMVGFCAKIAYATYTSVELLSKVVQPL